VLLAALAAGHVLYWYGGRERPAVPDPDDLPARLLDDPSFDLALWLPYPHQNLAVVEQALGGREGTEGWLAALLRLAEGRSEGRSEDGAVSIPAFGPFTVPPAREVTLARGREPQGGTERVQVAARIYPSLARIGWLAGAVAGNPWLAGGEVRALGGDARVSWDGGVWRISRGPEGREGATSSPAASFPQRLLPALARLRVGDRAATGDLPAGRYRLERSRDEGAGAGDLELVLEGGRGSETDALAAWERHFADAGVLAVLATGPRRERTGIAVVFAGDAAGGAAGDAGRGTSGRRPSLELPPAAVLAPASVASSESRRPRLVHEKLPSFLRGELERSAVGPWVVLATGDAALRAARPLAAGLPPPERLPDLGLWVDLPALRGFVGTVVEVMEEVPLFPRRELQRWRDLHTVLAPLEGFDRLVLLSTRETPAGGVGHPRLWRLRLNAAPPD